MTESIPRDKKFTKEGYIPNTEVVLVELHRLLAIFLASKNFAELRRNAGDKLTELDHLQHCEEDEITRILLVVAITARVIDDRQDHVFDLVAGDCGILTEAGTDKGLTLRESCNKILHATKVHFDLSETETRQKYLNPYIYLYGQRQGGAEWKAKLDIIKFAEEYVSCVRHF